MRWWAGSSAVTMLHVRPRASAQVFAEHRWNDGFSNEAIIDRRKLVFNSTSGFYRAQIVVLVSVKSPAEYQCLVLPVDKAEEAAQLNLDRSYRTLNADGSRKRPGPVWIALEYHPIPRDPAKVPSLKAEQDLVRPFRNKWDILDAVSSQ